MMRLPAHARRIAVLCFVFGLAVAGLCAQDWKTADNLPGMDLKGLTSTQKASVLKVMRAEACSCGCEMRLAECRVKDPNCAYSKGMAEVVIEAVKAGKTDQQAYDDAKASRWGHLPEPKLLDDPVTIPTAGSPAIGPDNAKITIVEFSDFQCPYCILATPQIEALLKAYPTQARLIFKQFPLEIHSKAFLAASAALAANKQGKFWPMHDAIFDHRDEMSRASFEQEAKNLGLNVDQFRRDMDSDQIKREIEKDVDDGMRAGVQGTPTIFLNGQRYNGAITVEALKPLFDSSLAAAPKSSQSSR